MTREELTKILGKLGSDLEGVVKEFKTTSYPNLPKWADLEKEYNPMKHEIITNLNRYPPKLNDKGGDDFKRTPLALQKLAVNRVAQSMFCTPVIRKYNYDSNNEKEEKAVEIFEEIYSTLNQIYATNIERAKQLNATCQVVTIWKTYAAETIVNGEISKLKLTHNVYSEKNGYALYPILDNNNELLILSVGYTDTSNVEHLMTYINGGVDDSQFFHFYKKGTWFIGEDSNMKLSVFPVVYAKYDEPIWGGLDSTKIVEELEEMESYQGLYIQRNSLPTFTLDYGEVDGGILSNEPEGEAEKSDKARRIIKVGKGGSMKDVTWEGAGETTQSRYDRLRNSFFEQIQVPDTSFSNMLKSRTSYENKELVFSDAKQKALDLGGAWLKLFYDESVIVKKIISVMYPAYAEALSKISVKSQLQPYSIKSKKDQAEFVGLGSEAMSLETQVRELNVVDNVKAEVERIQEENATNANLGFP